MDPQQRMFLQTAWHAVEAAGYAPRSGTPARTGVFAACGIDGYLIHHLDGGGLHDALDPGRWFLTETGSEKDYIATRVAYQLDLGGPAFTVNSACSSGLVALASAAAALRAGQCDMAIAGAATAPQLGAKKTPLGAPRSAGPLRRCCRCTRAFTALSACSTCVRSSEPARFRGCRRAGGASAAAAETATSSAESASPATVADHRAAVSVAREPHRAAAFAAAHARSAARCAALAIGGVHFAAMRI